MFLKATKHNEIDSQNSQDMVNKYGSLPIKQGHKYQENYRIEKNPTVSWNMQIESKYNNPNTLEILKQYNFKSTYFFLTNQQIISTG